MPQIPCFVVNLATDTARRHAMAERLKQQRINATFFPAVDGRIMPDAELESHVDRKNPSTKTSFSAHLGQKHAVIEPATNHHKLTWEV